MAELPMEILLYHILPLLPAKSVIRFATVSKEFHSFFKTHKFVKLHLHNVTNNHHKNHDKLLVLSPTNPLFSTIDYKAAPDDVLTPPSRPVPFLTYYPPHITMLTSFHGLICVGIQTTELGRRWFSDLVLWNPVTGDYKILSKTISFYGTDLHTFGLSYSSRDDDYKLVHATEIGNVYIYSLKSDSWKKLEVSTMDQRRPVYRVWLNENLYLLRYRPFAIMKLDAKTEMLTDITPYLPGLDWGNLIVHNGCLHFFVTYYGTEASNLEFEMWRLNEDGDWTKVDAGKVLDARSLSLEKKSVQVRILGDMATQRFTETLVSPNRYKNN